VSVNGTQVLDQPYSGDCYNDVSPQADIASLLNAGSNTITGTADGSDCGWSGCEGTRVRVMYSYTHSNAYVMGNNVIENNGWDGIYLNNINGEVTVSNNTIRNNYSGTGIYIFGNNGEINIINNTIVENSHGVRLESGSSSTLNILNNIIRENVWDDLFVYDNPEVDVRVNFFQQ
jgi:hypothetical protein